MHNISKQTIQLVYTSHPYLGTTEAYMSLYLGESFFQSVKMPTIKSWLQDMTKTSVLENNNDKS